MLISDTLTLDRNPGLWKGDLYSPCLFVCLFTCLLHAKTHLGPDGTRLKKMLKQGFKSLYKYAGLVVYGNTLIDWNRLKWKGKEEKDHGHSQQIKSDNFTVSLWVRRKKKLIQSQLPLRLCRDKNGLLGLRLMKEVMFHQDLLLYTKSVVCTGWSTASVP